MPLVYVAQVSVRPAMALLAATALDVTTPDVPDVFAPIVALSVVCKGACCMCGAVRERLGLHAGWGLTRDGEGLHVWLGWWHVLVPECVARPGRA